MKDNVELHKYSPGRHLLLDFEGAQHLSNLDLVKSALIHAAEACGATVLDINLHAFGQGNGVTGVALLAESHVSIHTWPEIEFAAIDIFMCGSCNARLAIAPLETAFKPKKVHLVEHLRGAELGVLISNN